MKIKKEKNNKAEITTQQIVLLIILLVSFAVILFFLLRLNLGNTSDEEVCHNSVVTRGSGVIPKESVPLNCKASYVCISKDGSCEAWSASHETEKVETKEEVYNVLANKMADCWWMYGEGKLNYVGDDWKKNLYCSICSQVAFDNSIDLFQNGEISQKEFYTYLANTNMSGKDTTYLDYLLGLKNSQLIEDTLKNNKSDFGTINLGKQYLIMMGIYNKVVGIWGWAAGGAVAGGIIAAVLSGGVSIPITIIIAIGATTGGAGGYLIGTGVRGESGHDYLSPTIIEATSTDLAKLDCASIKTLA